MLNNAVPAQTLARKGPECERLYHIVVAVDMHHAQFADLAGLARLQHLLLVELVRAN
jgi:hypothetical protein